MSSETGFALWAGNNPDTFLYYPGGSIDSSTEQALQNLSAADKAERARLSGSEMATSNWYAHRALQYIWAHPLPTLTAALRKVAAGFSWRLNPIAED